MSGVLTVLDTIGNTAAGGGGTTLSALTWTAVGGGSFAFISATNTVTLAGITDPVSLTATITGGAHLSTVLNTTTTLYTGAFTVVAGNKLAWFIVGVPGGGTKSGTVTVTNATTSTVISTFTYVVNG